jgi:hypothetical protein
MAARHPKSVRRRILLVLYDHYQEDPLQMLSPEELMEHGGLLREDLSANIHYLFDRGLVEMMTGYNPPMFAAVRMTADGIDLVENAHEFSRRYPPSAEELEGKMAEAPMLLDRLAEEADFAPLDGDARACLLRDINYLRDELARPADRWRKETVLTVVTWVAGHFDGDAEAHLPSLTKLQVGLKKTFS